MMETPFRLNQILSATDIRLSARCESGTRQLLAFVTGCGRLTLCYNATRDAKTVVKILSWFQDTSRRIVALDFDSTCTWLLVAGRDGSLYIVPALALVAPTLVLDKRWSSSDVTLISNSRPNGAAVAVAWWHCQVECHHLAVMATDRGEVVFTSLTERTRVGITSIARPITDLRLCQNPLLDAAFLLLTDVAGQQWRLLLEQRSTGFVWPLDNFTNANDAKTSETLATHNSLGVPTARSRLHGLKQLSVEKLAGLRQRLAESRNRGGKDSPEPRSRTPDSTRRGSTGSSSDDSKASPDWPNTRPMPEQLAQDTVLQPQRLRHRTVLSALYRAKNIVTVHAMNMDPGLPTSAHKLATKVSDDVVITDLFLFAVDVSRQSLTVVSTVFSECRLDGECDQNPEAILDRLDFHGDEQILNVFRLGDCDPIGSSSTTNQHSDRSKSSKDDRSRRSRSRGKDEARKVKEFALPSSVADIEAEHSRVDTCVVVTTAGIYRLDLRCRSVELFMELLLDRRELEQAERLAQALRLDLQRLLEAAGDLELGRRRFQQAIALYRLSRCRHLKSVLKFAAVGNSGQLLGYVNDLLATVGSTELSASERIHLANLAVMSHADLLLRADDKAANTKQFIGFLSTNQSYDQVLAVNVAGQTRLWKILHYLSSQRGLYPELLDVLTRVFGALLEGPGMGEPDDPSLDADLWLLGSDPALLPTLLAKPRQCGQHLANVRTCMPRLGRPVLSRLADMLDPCSPNFRPTLRRIFKSDGNNEEHSTNMGSDIILTYMLVLSRLVEPPPFDARFMHVERSAPDHGGGHEHDGAPRCTLLGAGFSHAALVRNAGLYTWGGVQQGCLGTGPTVSRFTSVQHVQALTSYRVEALSVSCGRQHTLALTNNGVYAWGSNQFGQLGVGRISRSSWPMLVSALSDHHIVQVSAGQYHSLALTSDGRVFAWGWAVHGQLGLGSIEDVHTPTLVSLLTPATMIAAGHAHSLALANDGSVYAFGSSMFGQLGVGSLVKQTRPVLVAGLPGPVVCVTTGYFHNLALTSSGALYTWGLSPQALRLQVQAQKKQRLLHKHSANQSEALANHMEAAASQSEALDSPSEVTNRGEVPIKAETPAEQCENSAKRSETSTNRSENSTNGSEALANRSEASTNRSENSTNRSEVSTNQSEDTTQDSSKNKKTSRNEDAEVNATRDREPNVDKPWAESGDISPTKIKKSFARSLQDFLTEIREPLTSNKEKKEQVKMDTQVKTDAQVKAEGHNVKPLQESNAMVTLIRHHKTGDGVKEAPSVTVDAPEEKSEVSIEEDATIGQAEVEKLPMVVSAYISEENANSHVSPTLVDTSLVAAKIVQVAAGGHHSALVTEDGSLYTWGRNLEGQLGCGGRREVTRPTRLVSLDSFGDKTTVREVACGSEFTVALTSSRAARVLAWGCNSSAQLGKPPVEDGKALDGKIVMIKTAKRVIKLPHGSSNAVDLPREVSGLPNVSITFRSSPTAGRCSRVLPNVERTAQGMHYLLSRLHGRYDSALLNDTLLALGHYQLAGKLAATEGRLDVALRCHLQAVEASYKRREETAREDEGGVETAREKHDDKVDVGDSSRERQDDNKVAEGGTEHFGHAIEMQIEPDQITNQSTIEIVSTNDLSKAEDGNEKVSSKDQDMEVATNSNDQKVEVATLSNLATSSNDQEVEVATAISLQEEEVSTSSNNKDEEVSNSSQSQEVEVATASNDQEGEVATASNDQEGEAATVSNSATDTEMHAFSVQGGTEEMSEGGSTVTTPSDSLSAPPITEEEEGQEREVREGDEPRVEDSESTNQDLERNANEFNSKVTELPKDSETTEPNVEYTETEIKVFESDDKRLETVVNEVKPKVNAIEPNKSEDKDLDYKSKDLVARVVDSDVRLVAIASQASLVVEHFLQDVGDDAPLEALLSEALDFWRRLGLPVEPLESVLGRHSTRVYYSLGALMFKDCHAEGPGSMLARFTSKFCLQVCTYVTSHIDIGKPHPEFLDLLRGANGCTALPVPSLKPSH